MTPNLSYKHCSILEADRAGAISLLFFRYAFYAAALLATVMAGAIIAPCNRTRQFTRRSGCALRFP
jgi:hypothetical protein